MELVAVINLMATDSWSVEAKAKVREIEEELKSAPAFS
jgi:hypothetical protein